MKCNISKDCGRYLLGLPFEVELFDSSRSKLLVLARKYTFLNLGLRKNYFCYTVDKYRFIQLF